ncbi:DUF2017 domain-containing protein [Corynebacterium sp. 13CS0277]|uniref:DUF2017 domain-containing protein n=1 Tax=Corynebacterium sp. 13CS0277 TaxID=2071994 RepID=UPI000D0288B2|nr:DUF2017 domain-containing protein [Corynebacterium sp. 13CS0277]PRQ10843.1 DUF2017 domain-containing protein [Corynebacterium sp. 13CS0277]
MKDWKKKRGLGRAPKFTATFEPMEREVLGDLAVAVSEALIRRAQSAPKDELAELTGMPSGHKHAPKDPSLARLLPDFEREGDEEYEGDNQLLRSLHETDICAAKLEHLNVVIWALGPAGDETVTLTEDEAHGWLQALNDIRLYLASSDVQDGPGPNDAADRDMLVDWLAYNQDSLLHAMMGDLG